MVQTITFENWQLKTKMVECNGFQEKNYSCRKDFAMKNGDNLKHGFPHGSKMDHNQNVIKVLMKSI